MFVVAALDRFHVEAMGAPLGSTLGAAGDGELLVLRSKLGIPSAANDQSGRLAPAEELPVPRRACVEPRLRYTGSGGGAPRPPPPRRRGTRACLPGLRRRSSPSPAAPALNLGFATRDVGRRTPDAGAGGG